VQPRILFLLKHREQPYSTTHYSYGFESGLLNSARFVQQMLEQSWIECKLVDVVDNNCIDREVHNYRPTHVIIEALWVVPSKFHELKKLHPDVKWIIRAHSELPFISNEGIAVEWIRAYLRIPNVYIAANSPAALRDFRTIARNTEGLDTERAEDKVVYLPNYYPHDQHALHGYRNVSGSHLQIGCFGAVRPLKNQLIQAVAAVRYAEATGKKLFFHINAGRTEQGGKENLRNIRALFSGTKHELVEHTWLLHDEFLALVSQMDLVLQVSMTETFCIVAADAVTMNTPIVVSPEVEWANRFSQANPTDLEDITEKIERSLESCLRRHLHRANRAGLAKYSEKTRAEWLRYFER
jgi:hypothetical protein